MNVATEFYHLTPSEKAGKIERKGIAANKHGEIFLFTNRIVANTIARDQVFTNRYTVFEINPDGITGTIIADKVSEFSASFQRIVKQDYLNIISQRENVLWPGVKIARKMITAMKNIPSLAEELYEEINKLYTNFDERLTTIEKQIRLDSDK